MGTLFNTICNGGTVVLANRLNFQERTRNCTVLVVTPSILDVLSTPQSRTDYPHLDRIFLGGETPSQQLLETWSAFNDVALWLAYGPTEATCAVLTGRLRASHDTGRFNPTQLGHCIPGSSVILLNNDMETIEGNDMEGEICIEGPCLTDGYWQDVGRTRDRFIEYHGRRIYRTGDLGRFVVTDDGDTVVSFCGRRDRVTKVRGFLVNLELDVDAGLRRLDSSITSVFSVVVDGKLCTAVVPASVDCRHLQAAWRLAAPSYLVPDKVVAFNDIPLTANGKVNPREVIDRLRDSIHKDKPLTNGVSVNTIDTDELKGNGRHSSSLAIDQVVIEGLQTILGVSQTEIDLNQSAVFQGVHSLAAAKLSTFCRRHGYAVTVETILTESSIHSLIDKSRYRRENGLDDQAVVQSPPIDTSPFSHGPITTLQRRMVLDSTVEDPKVNCIQHISRYKTEDIGALRKAWKSVVADEPIFQTCFDLDDWQPGKASQRLVGAGLFTWEEITITTPAAIDYNLRSLPSVTGLGSRFRVLHCVGPELPQKESIFVWAVHHALMDGYSASLLFEKVDNALRNEFFECSLPFTVAAHDIAEMQERMAPEVDLFWTEQEKRFPGAAGEPLIPETLTGNESVDFSEHFVETGIDNKRLRQAAQQAQATPAAIFYAAWAILLSCYTNADTVVFGAVFSGRNLPFSWAPSMVGPLLNVLPLRCQIQRGMESASFVREIHQSIQQLSRLQVADRPADTPPFATTLTVQDAGLSSGTSAIRSLQPPQVKESNLLPLTVLVEADGRVAFLYRTDRFRAGHVKDMAAIYTNLINALLEPGCDLQYAIDCRFPPEMKQAILHAGNIDVEATRVPSVNGGHTLTSLFGTAAALFPTHIAVEKGPHSITYAQFVRSAARVAAVIQHRAQPGEVVAILADRSINWIIGIFGVMIANTVYCPLDASYTAQYQRDLIRRSHAKLLLVSKKGQMQDVGSGTAAIAIAEILASDVEPLCPWRRQTPSDAAYLCFTSGSTGVPKGK